MVARRTEGVEIVVLDVQKTLDALRWHEDMVITNDFDERVWLKPLIRDGKRMGITDCCFEDDPCDWHKTVLAALKEKHDG